MTKREGMSGCKGIYKMTPKEQERFDIGYKIGYKKGKEDSVVHAHWVPFNSSAAGDIQYCSRCDIGYAEKTDYCPRCGAKMNESVDK